MGDAKERPGDTAKFSFVVSIFCATNCVTRRCENGMFRVMTCRAQSRQIVVGEGKLLK